MITSKSLCYKVKSEKEEFALKDISVTLEEGYLTCLLGHNGSGKTTFLRLLYGSLQPDSGTVSYNHSLISDRKRVRSSERAAYHNEVAYIGERFLVPWMTAEENASFFAPLYQNFDRKYFTRLLKSMGLNDTENQAYDTLSTGEKVKAEIAFALARHPNYLLLDEPFANLDPVVKTELLDILQRYVRETGAGILLTTHLVEEIADMTDYIAVMELGVLSEFGDRESVMGKYGTNSLRDVVSHGGK